jgi:penicillin-binding protein 1C
MRDNWCIGYSAKYTVGVWVGNFSGEPMWNVSGVTGAAPVWLEIMDYLHKGVPALSRRPPEGVTAAKVKFNKAFEAERLEWFIKGTEHGPAEIREQTAVRGPKITYPVKGMIIAVDPDIPEDLQRVFFEADSASGACYWTLNDRLLGKSSDIISWKPVAGDYTVSLVGPNENILDSVDFTVRGD